eukprot:symbB.v1.2.024787.t1/scaffold2245.1/size172089/13
MGQDTPEYYRRLLDQFPASRLDVAACDSQIGSATAEGIGLETQPAEASTSSAPAEVVDVEVELNTLNKIEIQAVQIITENPWHLYQSGILTLRDNRGERVLSHMGESVLCVREFYRLSSSQQEELRSQGITRLVWERMPLTGHSILFWMRAWEIGRMTAYVKNYVSDEERDEYNHNLAYHEHVGWLRDIPDPYVARPDDLNPLSIDRERIEREEDMKDHGELRMFGLFSEAIEDLYTGMVSDYVRKTPALWEEFAQRLPSGEMYLVDPNPHAPTPTVPTSENLCIDAHNNLKFSPRLCLWVVERKMAEVHENFTPGSFAEFCFGQLKQYLESRKEIQDDFYKHLVINTQTRTFQDPNYMNSIGSKVVIMPLAETFELSVKKTEQLQRTMVHHDIVSEGHSPPGEIPEETPQLGTEDLPTGEMSVTVEPSTSTGDLPPGEIPMKEEEAAEVSEYLPPGKKSKTEAAEADVEMESPEEEEEPPQDEPPRPVVVVDMPDYDPDEEDREDSIPEEEMMENATALVNSEAYDHFAHEEYPEEAIRGEHRFVPTRAMAKFLHRMVGKDEMKSMMEVEDEAKRIKELRKKSMEENAVKEEQEYGEALEEKKNNDIFTKTSSHEFLRRLAPETEEGVTEGQRNIEEMLMSGRQEYSRPHVNKMEELKSLEPEKQIKIEVPEPKPFEDPLKQEPDYSCPLDMLRMLDKQHQCKDFGFYGKYFRQTHSRLLDFYKYRKANPIYHPEQRFVIDEEGLMEMYVGLFYDKPTLEEQFWQVPVVYGCEDHRLRIADTDFQQRRAEIAKAKVEEGKIKLRDLIANSGKDEYAYDDLISDMTELFLSGESMERNPESLGTSSKSLTTLFWNLGNWKRGQNWNVPSFVDPDKIYYKENKPGQFPEHTAERNNLFLQMIRNLKAHLVMVCEAATLEPHRQYLESHGWTLCFNDMKDLCLMARLGLQGSIVQIAGPQEDSQESIWNGPNRKISFGIFEVVWGKGIPRARYAESSTGYFDRNQETEFEDMQRARMKTTRVCVYHVDHNAATKSHAVTGEIFAHMLFECVCHQVSIIGGDANCLSYQKAAVQLNGSYSMSTCQLWTDRFEHTVDSYLKQTLKVNKDVNARTFHSISYEDLKYLKETIEGLTELDPAIRKKTEMMGDCCIVTFFEYGLSTPDERFNDGENNGELEYKYSVNELLFYLTNDIMLIRERDTDAHCPLLITITPNEMTNQEKKNFVTRESKQQRAATRKEIQKVNKARGKASPECGVAHVPYFELMKSSGRQLSLAYQIIPFGAVIGKASERFNNPPLLYWGTELKCLNSMPTMESVRSMEGRKMTAAQAFQQCSVSRQFPCSDVGSKGF